MITHLRGTLWEKYPPHVVIDVGGVGYGLDVSMTTFYQLPEIQSDVSLFTHPVIREDTHQIFGFMSAKERELFRLLIKISGVGPKLALAILSSGSVDAVVTLFRDNSVTALTRLPGVGKKTAERLLIEMRDKLKDWSVATDVRPKGEVLLPGIVGIRQEAIDALVSLGFKTAEAEKAIARQPERVGMRAEHLIREALKALA